MQIAIVGCGNISRAHITGWQVVADATIACLCDIDPARAEERRRVRAAVPHRGRPARGLRLGC